MKNKKNKIIIGVITSIILIIIILVGFIKIKNNNKVIEYDCIAQYQLTESNSKKYNNIWHYNFSYNKHKNKYIHPRLVLAYIYNDLETYNLHKGSHVHIDGIEDEKIENKDNLTISYSYNFMITDDNSGIHKDIKIKEYLNFLKKKDYSCVVVK